MNNTITKPTTQNPPIIRYTNLTRGAGLFNIRAGVQLESRVLQDYTEIDPALGHNVVGAVLSILAHRVLLNDILGDSRLTVCLARRDTGQIVEVDLALYRRRRINEETYFLRFVDEREVGAGAE